MDEKELETLRLKVQVIAQNVILGWIVETAIPILLIPYQPETQSQTLKVILKKLDDLRVDLQQMTFPELSPEHSDLVAGEVQEAFETASTDSRIASATSAATALHSLGSM